MFFFFNDAATTEIYTLSLHDALPIYRRRVERARLASVAPGARDPRTGGVLPKQRWDRTGMSHRAVSEWLAANPLKSVRFESGCTCNAGAPVPATVLDPFAGSGTVGLVALREGRRAVLVEPSAEYRQIIVRRTLADEASS